MSSLCAAAHIDRNTFYSHYSIPEDVLKEILEDHERIVLRGISDTAPDLNYREMLLMVCEYMHENKELSFLIFSQCPGFSYLQRITDSSNARILEIFSKKANGINPQKLQWINRYATGGTTLLIQDWVLNGMKEAPEQMADKLNELNAFILNHYLLGQG